MRIAAAVVGTCLGLIVLSALVPRQTPSKTVSASTYNSIQNGQTEQEITQLLPGGGSDLHGGGNPPVGSHCWFYRSAAATTAYRFCFTGGRLVEKKTFRPGFQPKLLHALTQRY